MCYSEIRIRLKLSSVEWTGAASSDGERRYSTLLHYPTILMFTANRWKMADSGGSNPHSPGFTEKLKSWLCWSWTYICALWFAMVLTMVYVLRSPLKLQETVNAGVCLWSAVWMFTLQLNTGSLSAHRRRSSHKYTNSFVSMQTHGSLISRGTWKETFWSPCLTEFSMKSQWMVTEDVKCPKWL